MGAGPNAAASHLPGNSQHVATRVHPLKTQVPWKKMNKKKVLIDVAVTRRTFCEEKASAGTLE